MNYIFETWFDMKHFGMHLLQLGVVVINAQKIF